MAFGFLLFHISTLSGTVALADVPLVYLVFFACFSALHRSHEKKKMTGVERDDD